LWAAFCAADKDGSGTISKRELYNAIEAAGLRMTHTEKIKAYQYGDADDSGSMEWEEFRTVALKYKKLARVPLPPLASAGSSR
jgi:Ca2+-binding EF-hand superfamily protein